MTPHAPTDCVVLLDICLYCVSKTLLQAVQGNLSFYQCRSMFFFMALMHGMSMCSLYTWMHVRVWLLYSHSIIRCYVYLSKWLLFAWNWCSLQEKETSVYSIFRCCQWQSDVQTLFINYSWFLGSKNSVAEEEKRQSSASHWSLQHRQFVWHLCQYRTSCGSIIWS